MKRANCSALVPLESSDSWAAGALARGENKVVGGNRRRALRGPGAPAGGRGRTETPPAKLSACATCQAACDGGMGRAARAPSMAPHNRSAAVAREGRGRGAGAGRPSIAPYRNGTAPRGTQGAWRRCAATVRCVRISRATVHHRGRNGGRARAGRPGGRPSRRTGNERV